jgi:hypothetical protein
MPIIGAGFAGLIAAHAFQKEHLFEVAAAPAQMHRALLRFRSDAVSKLTGIDFRRVTVRKGLYHEGNFTEPSIGLANLYATKCLHKLVGERSVWDLDPVVRYVAPETFYEQLLDAVGDRIHWGHAFDFSGRTPASEPVISTAPMPLVLGQVGLAADTTFERAPITVQRFRVPDCDVHQTVYFPTHTHSVYRASITGNLLIVEHAGVNVHGSWLADVNAAFQLSWEIEPLDTVKQSYGKIAPIDDSLRKRLIHNLSTKHNIFSLGRFACWRNVLLDDVVNDAAVVRRLLHAHGYDRSIAAL